MKECECVSRKFLADVLSGDQEITIAENGDIIDCKTTAYAVGSFYCLDYGLKGE